MGHCVGSCITLHLYFSIDCSYVTLLLFRTFSTEYMSRSTSMQIIEIVACNRSVKINSEFINIDF